MMRFNLKLVIPSLCGAFMLLTVSIWTRCGGEIPNFHNALYNYKKEIINSNIQGDDSERGGPGGYEEIDCLINGDYSIPCRREGDEVYLPFSFIHRYFEVYGKLASYDGFERFEWSHSYSKIYSPKGKYDPRGVFLYFENYNVEIRERVKCISAAEGVPVSTQWQVQGYFYPTQVAQFGLAHYSKNLTEPEPRSKVLEDGSSILAEWVGRHYRLDNKLLFNTTDTAVVDAGEQVYLKVDHVLDFVLGVDLMLKRSDNSSMTVVLQNREKRESFFLHYICSPNHIAMKDNDIYHGLNCDSDEGTSLTRDLIIDLQKGLSLQGKMKKKLSRSKFKIISVVLEGSGWLDNLTLSSSQHLSQFYASANWFVRHQQKDTGGWPIPVKRKGPLGIKDLQPGWLSAMSQGHAMSVLSRAYYLSGDEIYLNAALKALEPFHVASEKGGVAAYFLNQLPWYEEYPTEPPSFVLNGFIYSLIGLYDLLTLAPAAQAQDARSLFSEGMTSLKKLLPLFDNGSGSNYDLRHFSSFSPPNLARWDYHSTHVNQLLLLATIDSDPILESTAHRWIGYMSGKKAPHN